MKLKDLWALLNDSWNAWSTDKAPRLGAALAYYTTFSLAPLRTVPLTSLVLVLHKSRVRKEAYATVQR
jgi:membrane protein